METIKPVCPPCPATHPTYPGRCICRERLHSTEDYCRVFYSNNTQQPAAKIRQDGEP